MQRSIHGLDGFIWAIGVVEDRDDPLFLGRCKVRYLYHHPESKEELPTDDLPWSYPLTPLDSGTNVVGPKEGDWVVAFFRDGILAQQPVMTGILPGIPEREANPDTGFYDPRPDSILTGHQVPRDPEPPKQKADGSGTEWDERSPKSRFPDNRYLTESRVSRLARAEKISETIVEQKKLNRFIGQVDIPSADHPPGTGSDVASPGDLYSELDVPYGTQYPYNHVYESEGGHMIEVDDTPGKERLHRYHRVGTFEEVHPNGSRVLKVANDNVEITLKRKFVHVEASKRETVDWNEKEYTNKDGKAGFNRDITVGPGGNLNITTEEGKLNINLNGDWNIYVNGIATIEVEEDLIATVHGNAHVKVDKNLYANIDGNADVHVGGNATIDVDGDLRESVGGDCIGVVAGDKTQYIGGDYTLVVGGDIEEYALGDIDRLAAGDISDVAVQKCLRGAGIEISDTAPVIFHNAAVTNCLALLTGITTDSDGDVTPAGPPGAPPNVSVPNVTKVAQGAQLAIESSLLEVPTPFDAFSLATEILFGELELRAEFQQTQINQNPDAPGYAPPGAAGSGPGGTNPKGGILVDGPGGFLWKPTGENSGVATILVSGKPDVAIYQAVPDGTDDTGKPKYKKGNKIEDAKYIKDFHGDGRSIYRLTKAGSDYVGPVIVDAGKDIVVEQPSVRHD